MSETMSQLQPVRVAPNAQLPQLVDAFTRLPRSSFHATLLELAGLRKEAQAMRLEAWSNFADGMALLHHTLANTFESRKPANIERLALDIGAGVREGLVTAEEASQIYTVAWAFAHTFLAAPDLADWLMMRREALLPGERFPCAMAPTERITDAQIAATTTRLITAAEASEEPSEVIRNLLRLEYLSSPSFAPHFTRIREFLADLEPRDDGARLCLVFCELERLLARSSEENRVAALALCEKLTEQVRDYRSREMLKLREVFLQAEDSPAKALQAALAIAPSNMRGSLVESATELVYLKAIESKDLETAARIALNRASDHSDLRFVASWTIRGLTMLRDNSSDFSEVASLAQNLFSRCRRLKSDSPLLYAALQDFAIGAGLHALPDEDVLQMARGVDGVEYDLLRAMLWLDDGEIHLEPSVNDSVPSELLGLFASHADGHPGLSTDIALFTRWGEGRRAFTISQYVRYFIHRSPEDVWDEGMRALSGEAAEPHAEDVWVLWAAARELGLLDEFVDQILQVAKFGTTEAQLHCRAALAESFTELGASDDLDRVLEDFPDAGWSDAIRVRREQEKRDATGTDAWSVIVEMREMVEPGESLSTAVESARQLIRENNPRRAARAFFEASRLTEDRTIQGRLLFMAARSIEEADAFSERAVELYERALKLDPLLARARSRLIAILARREDWAAVARTARDAGELPIPSDCRYVLEEAAMQLAKTRPGLAFDAWRIALDRLAMSDSLRDVLVRFELAGQCALASDKIDEFEALLERLRSRFEGTEFELAITEAQRSYEQVHESLASPLDAIRASRYEPRVIRIASRRMLESQSHEEVADALLAMSPEDPQSREALVEEIVFIIDESPLAPREKLRRFGLLHEHTSSPWVGIAEANSHAELGDYETAANTLETAARKVENHLDRAQVDRQLGKVFEVELLNREVALENYLVSFICDSGNAETLELLEDLYAKTGRYGDLVGAYEVALAHIEERNPSELHESQLRAKRALTLKTQMNEEDAAKGDLDWLHGRTTLERETINFIIENMRDEFSDIEISGWVRRIDVELDVLSEQEPDQVARWYSELRSTRAAAR